MAVMVALVRAILLEWQKPSLMGVDLRDNENKEDRKGNSFKNFAEKGRK